MQTYSSSIRVLNGVVFEGKSLDSCFSNSDSALAKQVCYGVLRDYYRLRSIVAQLLKKPLPAKHNDIFLLLISGIYSVDALRRPAYTSVNAAVQCAATLNKSWAKGLVNGVLRNYIRKTKEFNAPVGATPEVETNLPNWLSDRISIAWPTQALEIFAAYNSEPPMTLRINDNISREDFSKKLSENQIEGHWGALYKQAFYLSKPMPVEEIPDFETGQASVQDESSQMAALLLDLAPGQNVLDACAAPGGKTCHMLQACPEIKLTAIDKDAARLHRIDSNLQRIGATATVVACDLEDYRAPDLFDRILLDAPCSATGIIRRHPDIKLLRRDTDIVKLAQTQSTLLATAWDLLKVGGKLLYSTCSILPEENENIVSDFCMNHPNAAVLDLASEHDINWGLRTPTGRQLLPTTKAYDGFFYALLTKKAQ